MRSRDNYFVKLIKYIKNVYHVYKQIEYVSDKRVNSTYNSTDCFTSFEEISAKSKEF